MLKIFVIALSLAIASSEASAQVKIGVIAASTGPTSIVGIQQKNTLALLPKQVDGLSIDYIYMDDNSDPTQSTKNVQKLLIEDKIDALIGPSGSPNAVAVLPFIADSKTPMLAPVGSASVILPMDDKKKWVFKTTQNDILVMNALVENMKTAGVKNIAFIGTTDPLGDSFLASLKTASARAGIKIVLEERFARSDTSVTGQTLKVVAAAPEAVVIGTAGAATVLPHLALLDQGYKGKIYQTYGASTPEFLKLGGKRVEGALVAASPILVLSEVGEKMPIESQKVARDYIEAYKKLYSVEPGVFGANAYDAGLLLQRAIPVAAKTAAPGTPEFRAALRAALEATKNLPGTQGIFNMTPEDHSGLGERSIIMLTVKDGQWSVAK